MLDQQAVQSIHVSFKHVGEFPFPAKTPYPRLR